MSQDSGDFVRITNREIYDAIVRLKEEVSSMKAQMVTDKDETVDLKKRVRTLELRMYTLFSGAITAIPVLAKMAGVI